MVILEQLCSLAGHIDRAWHVSWRNDGKLLASCSGDKTIRIWSPPRTEGATQWECVAILEDAQNRTIRACEWYAHTDALLANTSRTH
jgi:WD40 repeat protein